LAEALSQTPLWELTVLPRSPNWILWGPTSKRGEGRGEDSEREGGGKRGRKDLRGETNWGREERGRETRPPN